jgi:hypothetical protein
LDPFIQSFEQPPAHLTLDLDAFDDEAHGQQRLIMFHGYYELYQYLPIVVTCAENDLVLLVGLRHGTCHAAPGADDDLRYIVGRLRQAFPGVQIHVRGNSGFGVPWMYAACEELHLWYTFRFSMNPRLQKMSDSLLKQAVSEYERTGQKQRLFLRAEYQAVSRQIVIKVEARSQGTNRRAVVTSRRGWMVSPAAVYDEYACRGESENRNRELKCELQADRLSAHRFLANFFRLYLHAAALNLLIRLRQAAALPSQTPRQLGLEAPLPAEAPDEPLRRKSFQRHRDHDPLREGFACTWRARLIKAAAQVITRARRAILRISSSWPHVEYLLRVSRLVLAIPPLPRPGG